MKYGKYMTMAAAALALAACAGRGSSSEEAAALEIPAITIKDTSCVVEYRYPATICGVQDVAIFPQVSGRIVKIDVVEGQYVAKGQVLFEIDDVPYRAGYDAALASVEVARSQVSSAEVDVESQQKLFDENIISEVPLKIAKNKLATARAMLGQSEAELRKAANDLSFTKVRTLISGYVGSLPYKVGSLVGDAMMEPLTKVSDNSSIYADFSIPESSYLQIAMDNVGDGRTESTEWIRNLPEVQLVTNNGLRYGHPGRVHSISGILSDKTGALPVRAVFPNPDRVLLSGGSCQVVFSYSDDSAILVPRSAMKEIQDKLFVFKINDDSTVSQIPVKASRFDNRYWMIDVSEDGRRALSAGDRITATTNRLKDGDLIVVKK